jgi:transposase
MRDRLCCVRCSGRCADDRPRSERTGVVGLATWICTKDMDGLTALAQQVLEEDPFSGALFAFRGRRGGLIKLLWYDGQGMCLYSKRLEKGHFV